MQDSPPQPVGRIAVYNKLVKGQRRIQGGRQSGNYLDSDTRGLLGPSMRRPVRVKRFLRSSAFFSVSMFFFIFPWSQAAFFATLPSALFVVRFFARCQFGVLVSIRCCYLISVLS